jgi:hypothetical protein
METKDVASFVHDLKKESPSRATQMFYALLKNHNLSVDEIAYQVGTLVGELKDFPETHLLMLQALMSAMKPTSENDNARFLRAKQAFPWVEGEGF